MVPACSIVPVLTMVWNLISLQFNLLGVLSEKIKVWLFKCINSNFFIKNPGLENILNQKLRLGKKTNWTSQIHAAVSGRIVQTAVSARQSKNLRLFTSGKICAVKLNRTVPSQGLGFTRTDILAMQKSATVERKNLLCDGSFKALIIQLCPQIMVPAWLMALS